jgi:hypothetical protein
MRKINPILFAIVLWFSQADHVAAQYVHIKVPLIICDGQNHKTILYFGVDSYATACIDPYLGEFELPDDRCGDAGLCAYFTDPPFDSAMCFGNGLLLDLRGYISPIQVDDYLVVFSTLDYPVTFHWPKTLNADYDSVRIHDAITGSIYSANMVTAESLVISNPSIQQILVTASGPKGVVDAVKNRASLPRTTSLSQNYPNPFNPTTEIRYTLAKSTPVSLKVYDVVGRIAGTLVDGIQTAGEYHATWMPDHIASGLYYYRLTTPDGVLTKAMLFIR